MMAFLAVVYPLAGIHRQVKIFAGKDKDHRAMCGDLLFREEESVDFLATLKAGARMMDTELEIRYE
jgi:hypothetical protein